MYETTLAQYRRERRLLEIPDFRREDLGHLVRYTPMRRDAEGFVCFATLPAGALDDEIRRQIAHFEALGSGFEWKVYGSDEPAGLRDRLRSAGFEQGEAEALMVCDVAAVDTAGAGRVGTVGAAGTAGTASDSIELRRIDETAMLEQIAAFQESIWGRSFAWLIPQLLSVRDRCTFIGAWDARRLVATGWIEYPPSSRFAELHGGAVLPGYRGRGIYSRLLAARIDDARRHDRQWVAVDAAPMSRPILETRGFDTLDTSFPMSWPARVRAAASTGAGID